jgi:hypothetical protein
MLIVAVGAVNFHLFLTPAQRDDLRSANCNDCWRGFLDHRRLGDADQARLRTLAQAARDGDLEIVRARLTAPASGIGRRDFELLRQDVRRAAAAYPRVPLSTLTYRAWLQVDKDAHVSPGRDDPRLPRMGDEGADWLDGAVEIALVKKELDRRATVEATEAYFAEVDAIDRSGPHAARPDGLWKVDYDGAQRTVVASEPSQSWRFPFVAEEWVGVDPASAGQVKSLPSFASRTDTPAAPGKK